MNHPLKDLWEILVTNKNSTEEEIRQKMEVYAKKNDIELWLLDRYIDVLREIAVKIAVSYHEEF